MSAHKKDRRNITPLTRAIDKYGWDKFTSEIIWQGPAEQMNEMEVYWIAETDAIKRGYNCTAGGDGWEPGERHPLYKKTLPAWWCKKISEGKKKGYHPMRGKPCPEWFGYRGHFGSDHHYSKSYIITDPDGNIFRTKGLAKFCREHNLWPQLMSKVACGKRNHTGGWKCEHIEGG